MLLSIKVNLHPCQLDWPIRLDLVLPIDTCIQHNQALKSQTKQHEQCCGHCTVHKAAGLRLTNLISFTFCYQHILLSCKLVHCSLVQRFWVRHSSRGGRGVEGGRIQVCNGCQVVWQLQVQLKNLAASSFSSGQGLKLRACGSALVLQLSKRLPKTIMPWVRSKRKTN